ncbi:UNVERIFIED_CONTAM: hypothetical protein HDU68_006103 [Siphonaria sp. JEL0065]|nr:hypothetical protein HDU68_006103 [Siphonaria sp. JEL0065]
MELVPVEVLARILSFLSPTHALLLRGTSRLFRFAVESSTFAALCSADFVWVALPPRLQTAFVKSRFGKTEAIEWSKTDFVLNWIPPAVGALESLTSLTANNCNLAGSIPDEINNLVSLLSLDLAFNALSGYIPPLDRLSKLVSLRLESNELFGPIPEHISCLSNCRTICLSNNQLSGSLPSSLGAISTLEQFYACRNKITGSIPIEFSKLMQLKELDLSKNRLSGTISPRLGKLGKLRALFLDHNQLSGPVPRQLGNCTCLEDLVLSNNRLGGRIPKELGNLKNMVTLQLNNNVLSGALPCEIGELPCIAELYLKGNILDPQIPEGFNRESRVYRLLREEEFDGFGDGYSERSSVCEENLSRPLSELSFSRQER